MSDYDTSAENLKALALKLVELLKIRTLPVGLKHFEEVAEISELLDSEYKKSGVLLETLKFDFDEAQR